jgi:UDP-GlcNAc:undecaprenyl-phosphate/decaprenyl-phosphate GlcNAc-1-phosphate transferase
MDFGLVWRYTARRKLGENGIMPDIMQFVPILIVGFAGSLVLTPLSRQIAMRLGVVDKPNQRKIHLDHKPMMGGLAIYVALAAALMLFSPKQYIAEFGAVLVGAAFLALVGLLDDRYELSARVRLIAQIAAASGLVVMGIKMRFLGTEWVDVPMTVIWVVVMTNATNYLDNMDGQSAGMTAIAAFFYMLIAFSQGLTLVSSLAAAVLGSALGFLVYNFNPSSTFMGDMGALPLGFILAVLAIKLEFDQAFSLRWLIPVFVLALPVFDVNLVTWTRVFEGRSPAEAGKDHSSHRLMSLGFSQRPTLVLIYGFCVLFGGLALLVSASPPDVALRLVVFGLLLLVGLAGLMVWLRQRYQKRPLPAANTPSVPIETPQVN